MRTDDYGYGPGGRKPDPKERCIKINLTRCREWWRRIWGPSGSEIDAILREIRKDALIRGAKNERLSKEALIAKLNEEIAGRQK